MELTQEQKKIARGKVNGHGAIRGIAGSGKTTVGVFRIPYLLENYCFDDDDRILVVTYNKTLINYVEELIEKHIKNFNQSSLFSVNESKVIKRTVDSVAYELFNSYCYKKGIKYKNIEYGSEGTKILKETIGKYKRLHKNIKQLENFNFIKKEIDWIRHCNYQEGEYRFADRKGMSSKSGEGPQKLAKDSPVREIIYEIMMEYRKELQRRSYIDYPDLRICAHREANITKKKYTHILVDEAQDLSKVQLELLSKLKSEKDYATITFLYDGAQSIYDQAWLGKGRSFKSVGLNMAGKGRVLRKNYRTTTQISQAAFSLLENQEGITKDEHFLKPELIDRNGEKPEFQIFEDLDGEATYIRNLIDTRLKNYLLKDITILGRKKNLLLELGHKLKVLGVKSKFVDKEAKAFSNDEVKLITMHSSKGLESPVVIMVNCNEDVVPYFKGKTETEKDEEEVSERKLFYVAMTRAKEVLFILAHGKESKFITDINKKYLAFDNKRKINAFYKVHIERYLFQNKLKDLYGNEERVRQWLLRELIDTYKYPNELIEIEHRVQFGSKIGYVDIVIYRKDRGIKEPYIFFEVKANNRINTDDIQQLHSYMTVTPSVEYGMLCDGNTIKIINKNRQEERDIPEYSPFLDSDILVKYVYKSFKTGRDCTLGYDENSLELLEAEKVTSYTIDETNEIPIIGDISAGLGSFMDADYKGTMRLPKKWSENAFILEVKGDSMIGAGINNGDLAVIRKQNHANGKDIVACAIEDECTLKQYSQSGNLAILSPYNPEYEPIIVEVDKVNSKILGLLVGVLKKQEEL